MKKDTTEFLVTGKSNIFNPVLAFFELKPINGPLKRPALGKV